MTKISRALLAPFDKAGIEEFAAALHDQGVEILATSGTAKRLAAAGIPVQEVSEYTGFPEMLGGRVKTLHPKVHGGILGRRDDPSHQAEMEAHGIPPIDLVCVNLYPFVETVANPDVTLAEAVEQIDIGGPTMLRAAAKNHAHVLPLIDPADYAEVLKRIDEDALDAGFRRALAAKAFRHTAQYDAAITQFLGEREREGVEATEDPFPATLTVTGEKVRTLRYGENPHQSAALYRVPGEAGLPAAEVLNGKPLSFNNLQDATGAYATVGEFADPCAVVVKHANPCGVAEADDLLTAFRRAWEGDPISAFGGILAFNRPLTADVAEAIAEPGRFVEVIIAPSVDADALKILQEKPKWGKNVRILACPAGKVGDFEVRTLPGGLLVQERDRISPSDADLKTVTGRKPTESELRDLRFAQSVCKHVKSNAIVLAKDRQVVGVGAGQMSRVDSARLAVNKAGEKAQGAVFASDAFLPFNDALEVALDAGAIAAVQPGGSRNDDQCIAFADERGIAMVFTGTRHFLH